MTSYRRGSLLLLNFLLSTGCASLTPLQVEGVIETPEPLPRRRASREASPEMNPEGEAMSASRRSALATHLAFLGTLGGVSDSIRRMSGALTQLKSGERGVSGRYAELCAPLLNDGLTRLRWLDGEVASITRLSNMASEMDEPDMQLALLRLGGPRLQATLLGSLLLEAWLDFIHLADVVLREWPSFGVERLLRKMYQVWALLEPSMTALSSLDSEQVESAATNVPSLTGHLAAEFLATRDAVRTSAERMATAIRVKEIVEMLTAVSVMKMALPRLLPPSTPATLGVGLVMDSRGVMMGHHLVVSAEWVEMMRRLVQAGVVSLHVVSVVVRAHAGQVLWAQSQDELPRGVRDALGDGPEVRGMRQTGRAGAGMAEPPRHHVLPREFREWFEKRGFTGEANIDRFCVKMDQASHEAIHGGGDWRLGRSWPNEWNQMIMTALRGAESKTGRMLTRSEILNIVSKRMRFYKIPMEFLPWRGG